MSQSFDRIAALCKPLLFRVFSPAFRYVSTTYPKLCVQGDQRLLLRVKVRLKEYFPYLEPQNASIGQFYGAQKRRFGVFRGSEIVKRSIGHATNCCVKSEPQLFTRHAWFAELGCIIFWHNSFLGRWSKNICLFWPYISGLKSADLWILFSSETSNNGCGASSMVICSVGLRHYQRA